MYSPLAFTPAPAPLGLPGLDGEPEDALIAMANPAFDSRIAVVIPGALDLTCELIRAGYQSATMVRVGDRPPSGRADIVIIPGAASAAFLERAIPFARRMLAPMGVVVMRLAQDNAQDRSDFSLQAARRLLLLNGLTAIRVEIRRGETLIGAELPLHGRLAAA